MKKEIIYEKEFPPIDFADLPQIGEMPSAEEFLKILEERYNSTKYIPVPDKIKNKEKFIRMAKDFSDKYKINVKILSKDGCITAVFSFDGAVCGGDIGRLMSMADEVSFFKGVNGRAFTITLDYHTHKAIRKGKIVTP